MNFDFSELTSLIAVRTFVINSIGISTITREQVNILNGVQLLLDEKIIGLLTEQSFQDYIGYADVHNAKQRAREITSIYSGILKK
jgi:hypothetical protein